MQTVRLQSGAFLSTVGKEKAFCLLGTFCYENVILTLSEGLPENAEKIAERAREETPGDTV